MKPGPVAASVDEYLAGLDQEWARASLTRLRELVREEAPDAQECISYGMPGYKWHGMLVYFAAFKNHCSFFPGGHVGQFSDELSGFKTSKGTIQFTESNPLPEELVRKIVRQRLAGNLAAAEAKRKL